jgi:hypothetical protein
MYCYSGCNPAVLIDARSARTPNICKEGRGSIMSTSPSESGRCPKTLYLTRHAWTPWTYTSPDACIQISTCRRCHAKRFRPDVHEWSVPEYRDEASCRRARRCSRCGKQARVPDEHVWEEADRGVRGCARCGREEVMCPQCDGSGQVWREGPGDCLNCGGTGVWGHTKSGNDYCPSCAGTGWSFGPHDSCLTCGGSGWIPAAVRSPAEHSLGGATPA